MQFGINKHEQSFQRLQKIAQARRASAICSLWKICECLFIPNCTRKIIWLLVNNIQVTISVTLQHFTWQMKATSQLLQLYWIKIWHVNSSVKIHSLSPSHVWKLRSFSELWKAVFTHSWILKNLTTKQRKNSLACGLDASSSQMSFEWLRNCEPCLRREETIQLSTSCLNQNTEKRS